jgi:hypothetical protein
MTDCRPLLADPRTAAVDRHSAALHMAATIRLNLAFCRTEGTMPDVETLLASAALAAEAHQAAAMLEILRIDQRRQRPALALVPA